MNPFTRAQRRDARQVIARDEGGQMAVFIALIFQVLFVFFAMVINIGLIVHDKINLQNSVDIGAYYAAQRQAEMLNEIAHLNYQVRQDYKLLSWRLRALGTFGRESHPLFPERAGDPAPDAPVTDPAVRDYPAFCTAHLYWLENRRISPRENLCRQTAGTVIPEIPSIPVIIDTFSGNAIVRSIIEGFRSNFDDACRVKGPRSWLFGANVIYAYRRSIAARKSMISVVSKNVSSPIIPGDSGFRDLRVQSVYDGVRKTIVKNLTQANQNGFQFQAVNGLATGQCALVPNNSYPYWLKEIAIDPVFTYMSTTQVGAGCQVNVDLLQNVPPHPIISLNDPNNVLRQLATGEFPDGHPYRSSRGFEKNPWCMAYVGVKATSSPRKPFSPFGQPITLTARAFASPFGGRIGPWDRTGWPRASDHSANGNMVDALAVPRTVPPGGPPNRNGRPEFVPNYSRFPGDTLGLKSMAALAATRPVFMGALVAGGETLTMNHFANLATLDQSGNPIAWDPAANARARIGEAELAGIAPDLFDISYYSIEADYYGNYYWKTAGKNTPRYSPSADLPFQFSDLGAVINNPDEETFNVKRQVGLADVRTEPTAYWIVRKPEHLLTGWTQRGAVDFGFSPDFGTCRRSPDKAANQPPVPGDCISGGRSGYSVRIVHREYLRHQSHQLGGTDTGAGPILNPPPEDF